MSLLLARVLRALLIVVLAGLATEVAVVCGANGTRNP